MNDPNGYAPAAPLEWFRSTPNAVLFGTSSFSEGVDGPGDALSYVIIDKMPYACPDDRLRNRLPKRVFP